MKRSCSLILLLAVALTMLCGMNAVAADETEQVQYQVTTDLDVYVADGDDYAKVFSVPDSYYVFKSGEAVDDDYTPIVYGNLTDAPQFFVKTSELRANAKIDDWDLSNDKKKGAYLPDVDLSLLDGAATNAYLPDGSIEPVTSVNYRITRLYGIRNEDDASSPLYGTYYFVKLEQLRSGEVVSSFDALVGANSTSNNGLTLNAPLHHEEKPDITPDDPVIDTPGDAAEPGQGNVVRGIMIALICVLCVVVIFLIFKPVKNRKDRYDL